MWKSKPGAGKVSRQREQHEAGPLRRGKGTRVAGAKKAEGQREVRAEAALEALVTDGELILRTREGLLSKVASYVAV